MTHPDAYLSDAAPDLATVPDWSMDPPDARTAAAPAPTGGAETTPTLTDPTAEVTHVATAGGDIDRSTTNVEAQRDSYSADHISIVNHNYRETEARPGSPATERSILVWEHIHSQAVRATPPPGLDNALATLVHRRILILAGDRGHGRNTACLLLAHRLAEHLGREIPVERLALDDDDTLDNVAPGNADGLTVVDLVDAAPTQRLRRLNEVGAVTSTMDDGHLILTIPGADREYAETRYPGWVHTLGRPDGGAVFRDMADGHLTAELMDELATDAWLAGQLDLAWPPRAVHLARLAIDSVAGGKTTGGEICGLVRAALADWTDELGTELGEPDAWQRSLLMAVALLEGADPGTIVAAARSLIACAGYRELNEPNPLVAPSVVKRVRDIGGVEVGPDGATFSRPEFGAAVLPHVWTEYPQLRPALRQWLIRLPSAVPMDQAALERLSDRVSELSVHHGAGIAIDLANRWAAGEPGAGAVGTRRSLAVRLLVSAGTDPVIGKPVRDQLWQWAHHSQHPGIQRVVAEVCGSQYGEMFPRNALTRLKHLSAREDPAVRRAVVSAVTGIGVHIGGYRLLDHLTDWLEQLRPEQAETVATAVNHALSSESIRVGLGTGPGPRSPWSGGTEDPVVRFWRCALGVMPYRLIPGMVGAWLAAVATFPAHRQPAFIERLVTATADDYRLIAQLSYAARPQSLPATPYDEQLEQLFIQIRTRLDETDPATEYRHQGASEENER